MTRVSSMQERRDRLGNSRDASLKKFDDIFPDDLLVGKCRPRLMSCPVNAFVTRVLHSPWEDPLPRVREESSQEISAEERTRPDTSEKRRHSWNLGVAPKVESPNIRTRSLRADSFGSNSSISSIPEALEDDSPCSSPPRLCPALRRSPVFVDNSAPLSLSYDDPYASADSYEIARRSPFECNVRTPPRIESPNLSNGLRKTSPLLLRVANASPVSSPKLPRRVADDVVTARARPLFTHARNASFGSSIDISDLPSISEPDVENE